MTSTGRELNEQDSKPTTKRLLLVVAFLGVLAAAAALLAWLWRRRRARPVEEARPAPPVVVPELRGLSEAEAQARQQEGQDNSVRFEPQRSTGDIWRDNVLNIFNLSLLGVAAFQFLLGLPLDGLLSLGVTGLNIGLNVIKEFWVRRKLQAIEQATRPQATVIREGQAKSIDASEIVRDDVLVAAPGDQFLVDGVLLDPFSDLGREGAAILVDQSMLDGASRRLARRAGDPVYAGSFCVSGRAAYQAQKVGAERRIASLATSTERAQESQTPLERIVTRVLTTLLAIVGILALLLLSRYLRLGTEWIPTEQIVSAAGVIFALAPAGLYFMIFLSYAMGSVQLARHGALIHRARSIEALANATVLCLTMQATRRSNTAITLEPLPGSQDADIAESRLRQILGDFARSSSAANQAMRAMVGAFPGERRAVLAEIPYLSAYGWSGVVLDDDDLRGVYVLGEPELLRPYLAQEGDEQAVEAEPGEGRLAAVRGRFASWGRRLRRRGKAPETLDGTPDPVEGTPAVPAAGQQDVAVAKAIEAPDPARSPEDEQGRRSAFRQWMGRARNTLRRRRGDQEAAVQAKEEDAEEPVQELVYLFAYAPEPAPLRDEDGRPQVPLSLIPLCRLHYTRQVRPETLDTLRAVAEMGIALKVFTPGPAEPEIALFRQAGLQWTEDASQQVVSGAELDGLEAELLAARVLESAIISHATPDLAGRVVQALRQQGESVVVVGDGPSDLPTMEQADLSIAWHNSSQAALGLADIVLLEDAPDVWLRALEKGQSIVNGLMDVLKLYLAVVACLTTLVIAIPMLGLGFPYHAKQGALINIATLVLPSLGLSLWAMPGVLPSKRLSLLLAWFAVPAAATMSLASLLLYYVFWVRTGELAYTQLALTHMLVFSGLALALLVRPTSRLRAPGSIRRGDRRLTIMVLVILGLFFGLASTPRLGEWLFHLSNLPQPADYGVIAVAALAWVLLALLIWWLAPERRFVAFLRRTLGVTHR